MTSASSEWCSIQRATCVRHPHGRITRGRPLVHDAGRTKTHLILDTGTTELTGHGTARCSPADANVPDQDEPSIPTYAASLFSSPRYGPMRP
ncbi:dsRBD fold-containing protein [Streptomyces sp. NPDC001027]|uniref:dsRBD fold-containing protein n=1 Tax=Streptomyces sp. NPDC001027 TaxID=3154771 RepID=UPI00333460A2